MGLLGALAAALLLLGAALGAAVPAGAQPCPGPTVFPDGVICADPGLRAGEAAMNAALEALRAGSGREGSGRDGRGRAGPERDRAWTQSLDDMQRFWLTLRDRACRGPDDATAAQQAACIATRTAARTAALAAGDPTPIRHEDAISLGGMAGVPMIAVGYYSRRDPRTRCTITALVPLIGRHRAADAFAAAMQQAVLGRDGQRCPGPGGGALDYDSGPYLLTYATARLVVLSLTSETRRAGRPPVARTESAAFDLAHRRMVAVGDLVDAPRAVPAIAAACARTVVEDLRHRGHAPAADLDAQLRRAAGDIGAWMLNADELRFVFRAGDLAAAAAGALECAVPMRVLRRYRRPGGPLR